MSSRFPPRAAAAPERFLGRGFERFLARPGMLRRGRAKSLDLGVVLPKELARFTGAVLGGAVASFVGRPLLPRFGALLAAAKRGAPAARARLVALLAGAVPFGETDSGEVVVYFLADDPAAEDLIATMDPTLLVCRGAGELALTCAMHAEGEEPDLPELGLAEEGAVHALVARGESLAAALLGTDAQLRAALRALARKPLDVPAREQGKRNARTSPLAVGALVEAFFREPVEALDAELDAHAASADAVVRDLVNLLQRACASKPSSAAAKELARRRALALRTKPATRTSPHADAEARVVTTRQIVERFDALPPNVETFAAVHERDELLLALASLGERSVTPALLDRALNGDAGAVDMLGALGERELAFELVARLGGEARRVRVWEASIVRMVVTVDAREAAPVLRSLLAESPLTGWREGLERGVLVRELVIALGELGHEEAAPLLMEILESKSQEYRAILPLAAHALGKLHHVPALDALERLLFSPKEPVTCEAVWAVGAIGQSNASVKDRAATLLEGLRNLEPGAEATRVAALSKVRAGSSARPTAAELRIAIDRALAEPAFRQEETSRRRAWALRALEDVAALRGRGAESAPLRFDHATVRHLLTRDDHRVRRAAASAFAAWGLQVPKPRPYFAFVLPAIEEEGGLDALLEAVRDPLGIFRHNVARRLSDLGDRRAVRAIAEVTARLFAGPPTSTYEYDDAPPPLVAFVRALAKLNDQESNGVLLEGLRSENHQIRAVVAENAPDDERFVPELMAMLGDPRSFLRSRAEKSLTSLGAIQPPVEPATTEIHAVTHRLQAER